MEKLLVALGHAREPRVAAGERRSSPRWSIALWAVSLLVAIIAISGLLPNRHWIDPEVAHISENSSRTGGRLQISVDVDLALVALDGNPVGTVTRITPLIITGLEIGWHEISATAKGNETRRRIYIESLDDPVDIHLLF